MSAAEVVEHPVTHRSDDPGVARVAVGEDRADPWVILIASALMAFGVAMVFSAAVDVRDAPIGQRSWLNTPLRQGAYAAVAFLAMLVGAGFDSTFWRGHGRRNWVVPAGVVALAVLLLVAVLIPGVGSSRLGARRALFIASGPLSVSFQPSEFAKIALVLGLASLVTRPGFDLRQFRSGFVPAVALTGVLVGLTGIEDFGTAALMGAVGAVLLVAAGARWLHVCGVGVMGLAAGALLIVTKPYRLVRLASFFSGAPDPEREGYQVNQAMIAIGSGGWWGRGLGNGIQKYGYIPHDDNDFIFAVICEELGIVGGFAVIAAFVALLVRGWVIAERCQDRFGRLLALGLTLMICLQAAFNIGVVTHSVPTKGISLPFVSAGGSGVVFLSLGAGLIAAVGRRREALAPGPRSA